MPDVWHLKSSGTPGWIESGWINAITQVSGGNRDKGTQSVCLLAGASGEAWAPGLLSASAWNGTQLTDLTSATLPWGPHRCLTKSPGGIAREPDHGECDECPGSLADERTRQPGLCVLIKPLKKPPVISLLGQTCPAGPTWSFPSACPIWKPHPLPSLLHPALIQHDSFFLSLPHSHSICQSYWPVSGFWSYPFVREYQFINQSVHTLIGWG